MRFLYRNGGAFGDGEASDGIVLNNVCMRERERERGDGESLLKNGEVFAQLVSKFEVDKEFGVGLTSPIKPVKSSWTRVNAPPTSSMIPSSPQT